MIFSGGGRILPGQAAALPKSTALPIYPARVSSSAARGSGRRRGVDRAAGSSWIEVRMARITSGPMLPSRRVVRPAIFDGHRLVHPAFRLRERAGAVAVGRDPTRSWPNRVSTRCPVPPRTAASTWSGRRGSTCGSSRRWSRPGRGDRCHGQATCRSQDVPRRVVDGRPEVVRGCPGRLLRRPARRVAKRIPVPIRRERRVERWRRVGRRIDAGSNVIEPTALEVLAGGQVIPMHAVVRVEDVDPTALLRDRDVRLAHLLPPPGRIADLHVRPGRGRSTRAGFLADLVLGLEQVQPLVEVTLTGLEGLGCAGDHRIRAGRGHVVEDVDSVVGSLHVIVAGSAVQAAPMPIVYP